MSAETEYYNNCYGENASKYCDLCSNVAVITPGEQNGIEVKFGNSQINECIDGGKGDNLAISGNDISETRSEVINQVP